MNKLERIQTCLGSAMCAFGAHTRMAIMAVATVFLLFGGIPAIKISDNITLPGYGQSAEAMQIGTALKALKYARMGSGVGAAWEFGSFIKRHSESIQLANWERDFWLWVDDNKYLLDIGDSDCKPLAIYGHYDTWKWCIAKHYKDIVAEFLSKASGCEWDWFGASKKAGHKYEIHHTDSTRWVYYSYLCEDYKHRWTGPCPSIYKANDLTFDGGKWRIQHYTPGRGGPQ